MVGKEKNGDVCFDLHIHFGRFSFWYTNFDLQRKLSLQNLKQADHFAEERKMER